MTTLPAPARVCKPRNVKPAHGKAGLTLHVNGQDYRVCRLEPHPAVAGKGFRLTKPDGTHYDVATTPHGVTCECGDWVFHRDGKDPDGCKHVKALRAWGLLPPLPPAARSTGQLAANDPEGYERMMAELDNDPHRPESPPWTDEDFAAFEAQEMAELAELPEVGEACGQCFDDDVPEVA